MGVPELFSSFIHCKAAQGPVTAPSEKGYWANPQQVPQWERDTRNSINSPAQIQSWHQHSPVKLLLLCRHLPLHTKPVSSLQLSPLLHPSPGETSATFVWGQVFTWDGKFALLVRRSRDCLLCNTRCQLHSLSGSYLSILLPQQWPHSEPAIHVHSTHPTPAELCVNEDCSLPHRARLPWAARQAFTGEKLGWPTHHWLWIYLQLTAAY